MVCWRFKAEITLQEFILHFNVFLLRKTLGGTRCGRVISIHHLLMGLGLCPVESPGSCMQGTPWGRSMGDELRTHPLLFLLLSYLPAPF